MADFCTERIADTTASSFTGLRAGVFSGPHSAALALDTAKAGLLFLGTTYQTTSHLNSLCTFVFMNANMQHSNIHAERDQDQRPVVEPRGQVDAMPVFEPDCTR